VFIVYPSGPITGEGMPQRLRLSFFLFFLLFAAEFLFAFFNFVCGPENVVE
jgi:hypothetical protein